MKKIKICLTDDHKMFREGLRFLLEQLDDVQEVKEASTGGECLSLLTDWVPDLIFMDIEMPVLNGIECSKKILAQHHEIKIIALSMYSDEEYYESMIEAGASGFILKNSGFDEVKNAINKVMSGHNHFSPSILDNFVMKLYRSKECNEKKNSELSGREIEILFHICKGMSNAEIAEKLNISKRTVDKHRENIMLKTETKNTAGLVMYAVRKGIAKV